MQLQLKKKKKKYRIRLAEIAFLYTLQFKTNLNTAFPISIFISNSLGVKRFKKYLLKQYLMHISRTSTSQIYS